MVTVIFLMGVAYTVLLERKLVGRIQNRWGPSRVGPFGLLQPLVDGAKSFLKEDMIPTAVYQPALPARSHDLAWLRAHLHRRRSLRRIRTSTTTASDLFQISDVNIGLLVILGVTSIGVYGIALAGWSSNNKYSLLGSLRSSAQLISYELALGLSLVGVVLRAGSLNLRVIVENQARLGMSQLEHLRRASVHRLLHLPHGRLCRDQPFPLRSARSRKRTHRRLSHRVQLHEIRHVLHGRIRQHDHRGLRGDPALSGRLDQPLRQPDPDVRTTSSSRPSFRSSGLSSRFSVSLFLYVWVRGTLPRFRYDQLMNYRMAVSAAARHPQHRRHKPLARVPLSN